MKTESPSSGFIPIYMKRTVVNDANVAMKNERARVILLSSFLDIGPANKKAKADNPETD